MDPSSNLDSTHLELEKLGARGHGGSILYEQFLDNSVDRGRHLRMAKTSQCSGEWISSIRKKNIHSKVTVPVAYVLMVCPMTVSVLVLTVPVLDKLSKSKHAPGRDVRYPYRAVSYE